MLEKYGSLDTRTSNQHGSSILVIDDEPAFCGVMSELLNSFGYRVRFAYNASQALDLILQEPPDLILTDVMMPGEDGLSLIRHLQQEPSWSSIPIIVVSAKAQPEDITATEMAGADACLIKPFSASELREAVRVFLRPYGKSQ